MESMKTLKGLMNTSAISVNLDEVKPVTLTHLSCSNGSVPMFKGNKALPLVSWIRDNLQSVQQAFETHHALLFRGFNLDSKEAFIQVTKQFSLPLLDYNEPSTPRSKVSDKVYTSTEYPKEQSIPQHNEHSYTTNWPKRIWFYCKKEAEKGGETPIADSRLIFQQIDQAIKEEFSKKGVLYVRNYSDKLDLPWQHVFQTEDPSVLEKQLKAKGIDFKWKEDGSLCTKQQAQVTLEHPDTEESVWFNQAHLFHVSNLQNEIKEYLIDTYGIDNVPRNTYFGDGSPIPESYLEHIREVYRNNELVFSWEEGDVLMLDNIMYSHGRNPFEGDREILVAMADPMHLEEASNGANANQVIKETRQNTAEFFVKKANGSVPNDQLKYRLAASYRMMVSEQLDEGGISGHISLRVPGNPGLFWVNPFGLLAEDVKPDNLIMVDKKGNVVEGDHPVNVAGFCIHAAIHEAHPEINCIAHTHSPWGTLFSALNKKILPLDQNCCMFFEDHALYSQYNGAVTDAEDAQRISKALGNNHSIILQNHGTITCGATLEGAIIRMIAIERAYRLNFLAQQVMSQVQLIDPEVARSTKDWIGNELGLKIEFDALLKKVERLYPDLK
ncbi:TauD/TfdA family dioxygenase [Sinomicrobium weinanense]|uniref:TauD/TfdA family dioxygenase n=1 Tax=Sinomicrobium weinanense TaxID=2842200 RepID=A0A926JPS8_9FLAO|nr:TauD/TfdA family dioxygenase [Sinomicrobium weinanense]MBC9795245.1 TauD/TfdA family dioxygenase [Sinomicrobium weinanense]MBU3125717.1 TauD/TfdA family dioxygenase [Sinomicrobium weinanense]